MSLLHAASRTFKVPVILASLDFTGSFMLLGTLGSAAWCRTYSHPSKICLRSAEIILSLKISILS
jgi:hypothetical protein